MDTKNFVMKEAANQEIADVFNQNHVAAENWLITFKEDKVCAGYAALKAVEQSVIEIIIVLKEDVLCFEDEVLECLLNHSFYRMNARKVQMNCACYDRHKKELLNHFRFRNDSAEQFILYKEEYIEWLRNRGKLLNFLNPNYLRVVFVLTALTGLVLFGIDAARKMNTMQTLFYAYITGIGVAGAFACSWLSAKERTGK